MTCLLKQINFQDVNFSRKGVHVHSKMSTSQEHILVCTKMSTSQEHIHVRSKMLTSQQLIRVLHDGVHSDAPQNVRFSRAHCMREAKS